MVFNLAPLIFASLRFLFFVSYFLFKISICETVSGKLIVKITFCILNCLLNCLLELPPELPPALAGGHQIMQSYYGL
jgi:hypothetical protein